MERIGWVIPHRLSGLPEHLLKTLPQNFKFLFKLHYTNQHIAMMTRKKGRVKQKLGKTKEKGGKTKVKKMVKQKKKANKNTGRCGLPVRR